MEAAKRSNLSNGRVATRLLRQASALFLFLCVPLSLWETNVHSKIFVFQNPDATAHNLLANEFGFRMTIVSHILGTVVFVVIALLFYRLLNHVDKQLAHFMIIPIIAQLVIVFLLGGINFSALMILKGETRIAFDASYQQEVVYLLLRIPRLILGAVKIIFGLFFIPLGLLVIRSGFFPKFIGVLIALGGIGYVMDTCMYILLQRAEYMTVGSFKLVATASYSLAFFWFLIKGANKQNPTIRE